MGLKPGTTNNPNGRPKGSLNKVSSDLREQIQTFLTNKFSTLVKDFDGLSPKNKLAMFTGLMPFAIPKLQSLDVNAHIDHLSDVQVDELFNRVLEQLSNKTKSNG